MPKPTQNESKKEFIDRFMSDNKANKDYPDKEQRLAIANSMWKEHNKNKKESRFSHDSIIEIKEVDGDLIVRGYISTTHFDGQDRVTKSALDKWAKEINDGVPRANKVSINHNRMSHVAGVGIKGTAKVELLSDGNYGLYVETLVDKTREDFKEIKYRVDNNLLDSFSIEYIANEFKEDDLGVRILDENTELHGWTLASQPMNEYAVMIKELITRDDKVEITNKNKQEVKEDKIKMTEQKENVPIMSEADKALLLEAKEMKAKEARLLEIKELMKDDSFQKELKELMPEPKVLQNKEEDEPKKPEEKPEEKESKNRAIEFKEIVMNKELDVSTKFKEVGLLAEKEGMIWVEGTDKLGFKQSKEAKGGMQFKNFRTNGSRMEFKGLSITTNQNSDTDYLLSAAELRDMFDPVIYDALNQSVTTWGLLRKEDFSNKGNNQVQFVLETGANGTAAFYTGNSVSTGNSDLINMQTKFKKVQVGISVDGDMIAAARGGPIGDVFGKHVELGTKNMLNVVNKALFAENGAETDAECIGFEYITDSAGNATLYNLTRSTTNKLSPDSASDTYINGSSARISLDNMRLAIEQAVKEGANINNLIFVTHPTQERLFKGIYDANQILMPTSSRFGFVGRPEFDSVPIFADKDCNTDDWFLVDLESHKVAVWVPPTLEMLGKRSDAEEGFVKMYFASYNVVPRRMVQIYGNATS